MSEQGKDNPLASAVEIRIERLNADKTRKDIGSETVYHVYFELSDSPPPEWRRIFAQEWNKLNQTQEANIDEAFLVLHCPLQEIAAAQLPALKKAVASSNEAYQRYSQEEATTLEHREDAWKQERKDVDTMATSLRFD